MSGAEIAVEGGCRITDLWLERGCRPGRGSIGANTGEPIAVSVAPGVWRSYVAAAVIGIPELAGLAEDPEKVVARRFMLYAGQQSCGRYPLFKRNAWALRHDHRRRCSRCLLAFPVERVLADDLPAFQCFMRGQTVDCTRKFVELVDPAGAAGTDFCVAVRGYVQRQEMLGGIEEVTQHLALGYLEDCA